MASEERGNGFRIWGVDNVVYGPVELPGLVAWIKDQRVTAETWVFAEQEDRWHKAAMVPELKMFFKPSATPHSASTQTEDCLKPGALRRIKVLAGLNEAQLERFVDFVEVQRIKQWAMVVKQGDHGDALFLVVEGELRVRLMAPAGQESILTTLGPGDFFGEVSLFDHGPRSADVLANLDSVLLKLSSVNFDRLVEEAPEIAASFLRAASKTLTARIRADNKRYRDSLLITHAAGRGA